MIQKFPKSFPTVRYAIFITGNQLGKSLAQRRKVE
jgi:hypothetical protein